MEMCVISFAIVGLNWIPEIVIMLCTVAIIALIIFVSGGKNHHRARPDSDRHLTDDSDSNLKMPPPTIANNSLNASSTLGPTTESNPDTVSILYHLRGILEKKNQISRTLLTRNARLLKDLKLDEIDQESLLLDLEESLDLLEPLQLENLLPATVAHPTLGQLAEAIANSLAARK